MKHWKKEYAQEALEIAAAMVEESGRRWLADQMRRHKAGDRFETRLAMRALMVARGDISN
jgi:hypothetical protein